MTRRSVLEVGVELGRDQARVRAPPVGDDEATAFRDQGAFGRRGQKGLGNLADRQCRDAVPGCHRVGIEGEAAQDLLDRIAPRPVLMIYAENDMLVPVEEQLSCFAALGEPKKLVKLPNCQHYESYQFCNPEMHAIQKRAALEWYETYL